MRNNRVRVYFAHPDLILNLLQGLDRLDRLEVFGLPHISCIPPGAVVEQVWWEPQRHAWALLIAHASFDEVLPGEVAPALNEPYLTFSVFRRRSLLDSHEPGIPMPVEPAYYQQGPIDESWRDRPPLL